MKVLLKQDVKSIGKKDEIHEVSDGYARNYLMPRGLAVSADAGAISMVKDKAAAKSHHEQEALDAAKALAAKIDGKTVTIKAKAGQNGKLFGAVTSKDIAQLISSVCGAEVDKRKIVLDSDIKSYGVYTVDVKIHVGVVAKVNVDVSE